MRFFGIDVTLFPMQPTAQTPQQIFNAAYWLSFPPAIQALQTASNRIAAALALFAQGYTIDPYIMLLSQDPYNTMSARLAAGELFVPPYGMQPLGASSGYALPNVPPQPGQLAYPAAMPAGWIAVSDNPASYPPYAPVAAPQPSAGTVYTLGPQISTGRYMLSSSTGTFPAAGTELTVGGITGTVVEIDPLGMMGLQA